MNDRKVKWSVFVLFKRVMQNLKFIIEFFVIKP